VAQNRGKSAGSRSDIRQALRQSFADRRADTRDEIERFLIVCEGMETEPNYFQSFRVPTEVINVQGTGTNTIRVVEEAISRRDADDNKGITYDQVWCVFDHDSFPATHFNEALDLAKRQNIKVAYSHEAFEIWYLLHFDYIDIPIARQDYRAKLTSRLQDAELKVVYEKNSKTMYADLLSQQQAAIRNAKKLHRRYNPHYPEKDNPCTTVYLLVEELNKYLI